MIRPKNFRDLKKSVITQNQSQNQEIQYYSNSQENHQSIINVNVSNNNINTNYKTFYNQRPSFTKISFNNNPQYDSNTKQTIYYKPSIYIQPRNLQNQYYNTQSKNNHNNYKYASPIKRPTNFLSPTMKYQCNEKQSDNKKDTIFSDPIVNKVPLISTNNNNTNNNSSSSNYSNSQNKDKNQCMLKFDPSIKRKLNFNNISQKSMKQNKQSKQSKQPKQKFSSNKKSIPGNISFKSIIENSPQCKELQSQRIAKNQNSNNKQPSTSPIKPHKFIQSQRQPQRQNSLTKLKYQFAGIKKMMNKHQSEKDNVDRLVLDKSKNSSQNNQSTTVSITKGSFSQPQKKFENINFTKQFTKKESYKRVDEASPIHSKSKVQLKLDSSPIIGKGKNSVLLSKTPKNVNKIDLKKDINILFKDKTPLQQRAVLNQSIGDQVNVSRASIGSELDMNPFI